jgi:uncharacterized membrane-anchored protein
MKRLILIAWALVLLVAGSVIVAKEALLANGDTVYLKLAPVDPRSLMQGDYMALNFEIGNQIRSAAKGDKPVAAGVAVIRLDDKGVASFVRAHDGEPLATGERLLRYQFSTGRWGNTTVKISTDAYFFEEGMADAFAKARYGEFRVDASGQALLVSMRNEQLELLPKADAVKPQP